MNYWLFKSEPSSAAGYAWDDIGDSGDKITFEVVDIVCSATDLLQYEGRYPQGIFFLLSAVCRKLPIALRNC